MDKAKGRINEVGGTKDHVRDELDEVAERGRREETTARRLSPRKWGSVAQGQGQCPGGVGRVAEPSLVRMANS